MDAERVPPSEPEPPMPEGEEPVPGMGTLPGRAAQALTAAGYAPGKSGLWSGADPVLRNLLIILIAAWYVVLLLPVNQVLFVLGTPLADFLMERFDAGDVGAFITAYTFWACLWQSMFAIMCYFACGWPPIAREGQPSHPHGPGPALRATYWYLLADAILFFPFLILYLFIYSGFQIGPVLYFLFFPGVLLSAILFLLLGGLFLNALLALTLGLGAYWLAARLGGQTSSKRRRERGKEAGGPALTSPARDKSSGSADRPAHSSP
ncbi:hypothetical protein [Thermogemmatispora onikobensis]|uniref:hypothetical protein n=1 Tax=Thermogemmatispora onikobensis TaxID=732234 RepID=UPI0008530050|nr:hypothetical protein [Thermogemmatispora onikobensis]